MVKGQGHLERKFKNRFLHREWIDLRQTKTKMISSPFYTYRRIGLHFTGGNAPFVVFVCLSVCLSHTVRLLNNGTW